MRYSDFKSSYSYLYNIFLLVFVCLFFVRIGGPSVLFIMGNMENSRQANRPVKVEQVKPAPLAFRVLVAIVGFILFAFGIFQVFALKDLRNPIPWGGISIGFIYYILDVFEKFAF